TMRKTISLFAALLLIVLAGCATFRGIGEDFRSLGKGLQKTFSGNRAEIRDGQQRLRAAGYNPGSIDGLMGRQTRTALRRYQSAHGLDETGEFDKETRTSLGMK
ncbi:MAG: peptidoglycan-binding protein, partial [Candidatus Methylomirabilales bacterium]